MRRSELRKDYIQDKYVIIAPRRVHRPHDVVQDFNFEESAQRAQVEELVCALCPARIDRTRALLAVGGKNKWRINVVPNKYPAVSPDNPRAYGAQEVVIETPTHEPELEELSVSHIAELIKVYAARTRALSRNKRIQYILIFKNNGGRAGASLAHSHSQIFATGFIPPHLADKSEKMNEYKLVHGTCVYCDTIQKERTGPRFVYEDRQVIAFCPYASMHNYEVWILPKRHLDNVTLLNGVERASWARILKHLLGKIVREIRLPYNYYFHQVIHDEDQHLYMKITPRGSVWAGVEIGSGIIINPVPPEEAAKLYRVRSA